jgi:polyferredoxin
MVADCWMAKGQSSGVIVLSYFEIAWLSIDHAAAQSVSFERSKRPFCYAALTPLNMSFWFLLSIAF